MTKPMGTTIGRSRAVAKRPHADAEKKCFVPRCPGPCATHAEVYVGISDTGTYKVEEWMHHYDSTTGYRHCWLVARSYYGDDRRKCLKSAARRQRAWAKTDTPFVRTGEPI